MEEMNFLRGTIGTGLIWDAEEFGRFPSPWDDGIESTYTRSFRCIGTGADLFTTFRCPRGNAIWMRYRRCPPVGGKQIFSPRISSRGPTGNPRPMKGSGNC